MPDPGRDSMGVSASSCSGTTFSSTTSENFHVHNLLRIPRIERGSICIGGYRQGHPLLSVMYTGKGFISPQCLKVWIGLALPCKGQNCSENVNAKPFTTNHLSPGPILNLPVAPPMTLASCSGGQVLRLRPYFTVCGLPNSATYYSIYV